MKNLVFTIIYFKDGKFSMISANCFKKRSSAERCAGAFCQLRMGDSCSWTYNIEELILR